MPLRPKELNVSEVKTIPYGTQYRYKCLRGVYGNMASDQLKPVRLLDSAEKKDFFALFEELER